MNESMRGRWIIDDMGNVERSGSRKLAARLGVSATAEVEEFAIESGGFIGLSRGRQGWHVRFRPAVVPAPAVAGLFYWLHSDPTEQASVSWLAENGTWHLHGFGTLQATMSFIAYILESGDKASYVKLPRIQAVPSPRAKARWDVYATGILDLLRTGGPDALAPLLDDCFAGRWSLFHVSPPGRSVVFQQGRGLPPLDPKRTWSLEGLVDQQYAEWCEASYRDASARMSPLFQDVDAIVEWPRLGDLRTRYWRIVAPLSSSAGSCLLLIASGNDSSINLRPQNVDEACELFDRIIDGHP